MHCCSHARLWMQNYIKPKDYGHEKWYDDANWKEEAVNVSLGYIFLFKTSRGNTFKSNGFLTSDMLTALSPRAIKSTKDLGGFIAGFRKKQARQMNDSISLEEETAFVFLLEVRRRRFFGRTTKCDIVHTTVRILFECIGVDCCGSSLGPNKPLKATRSGVKKKLCRSSTISGRRSRGSLPRLTRNA